MPTAEAVRPIPWACERPSASRPWPRTVENIELTSRLEQARKALVEVDDEESPRASRSAFDRAANFLKASSGHIRYQGKEMRLPDIGLGPSGSIDLHWKASSWELLVNIPAELDALATFYGDNYGTQKVRGSMNPETDTEAIANWLMK
jgi:hypothetical protein